jgi:hypothetical protein
MKRSSGALSPRPIDPRFSGMPDPETNPANAQFKLCGYADKGLREKFLRGAEAYSAPDRPGVNRFHGKGIELEFEREHVTPENLDFFIDVLPDCPQITGIELPIPATSGQAERLAKALARNSGLKWLQLYVSGKAPPDSTVLHWLFSHQAARANALSELRIDIEDGPAGDTDWMRPLCHALSTHLQAESAQLTVPWTDGRLKLLGDTICTSRLSSLTLGGSLTGFGTLHLLDALKNSGGQLASLSFPDSHFDKAAVDAVITAIGYISSLTELKLGKTLLTSDQAKSVTTTLEHNKKNIESWHFLSGPGRV